VRIARNQVQRQKWFAYVVDPNLEEYTEDEIREAMEAQLADVQSRVLAEARR
jgi:hypothetical protein